MSVDRLPVPTDDRKPAWRRACLAYRQWRAAGASDQEAHEAAVPVVQTVLPLPWNEASVEAVSAVAYATRYHPEWFWRGAQHAAKWRGTANLRTSHRPGAASTNAVQVRAAPARGFAHVTRSRWAVTLSGSD